MVFIDVNVDIIDLKTSDTTNTSKTTNRYKNSGILIL